MNSNIESLKSLRKIELFRKKYLIIYSCVDYLKTTQNIIQIIINLMSLSPLNSFSDISKAFPDMTDVFSDIDFYNESKELEKFIGYKDKVLLVFFGYTHCPDVCPTTVLDMARVLKRIG